MGSLLSKHHGKGTQYICIENLVGIVLELDRNISVRILSNLTLMKHDTSIWSEWRLTVIAATVRIALVDILDLSEVDIPAGGFLYPAVGWG